MDLIEENLGVKIEKKRKRIQWRRLTKMAAMVGVLVVAAMMIYQIRREQGRGLAPGVGQTRKTSEGSSSTRRVGPSSERRRRGSIFLKTRRGSLLKISLGLLSTMRSSRKRRRRMRLSLSTVMRRIDR